MSHRAILLLMLWNSSGIMSAGLANIDGTASVTCNFKYHTWFQILIKRWFQGKQVLCFLVLKLIWISHNCFSLLANFWVMFPLYWTKNLVLGSLLLRLLLLRCFSIWGDLTVIFSRMTILSNVSLTILEDHSIGYWYSVQISSFYLRPTSKDCQSMVALKKFKNSMHSPLNHIFLML